MPKKSKSRSWINRLITLGNRMMFVNVTRDRDEISVINMDPIEHDIQGYETARQRGARVLFNCPLPMNAFHQLAGVFGHKHLPGELMVEAIHLRKRRNIFVMQCGFHPYMFSWGLVVNNPLLRNYEGGWKVRNRGHPAWGLYPFRLAPWGE